MSDSLIGVIIGGCIGLIPILLSAFFTWMNAKAEREHQVKMKQVEFYMIEKRDKLQKFMYCLGRVSYSDSFPYEYMLEYLAAAKEVCLYVSDNNALMIESVSKSVIQYYNDKDYKRQLLDESHVRSLNLALKEELASCVSTLDDKRHKK